MNSKDAAVYKILADLGFDYGHEIPDPKDDEMVNRILGHDVPSDEAFLNAVEDLFTPTPK